MAGLCPLLVLERLAHLLLEGVERRGAHRVRVVDDREEEGDDEDEDAELERDEEERPEYGLDARQVPVDAAEAGDAHDEREEGMPHRRELLELGAKDVLEGNGEGAEEEEKEGEDELEVAARVAEGGAGEVKLANRARGKSSRYLKRSIGSPT